MHLFLKEMIYKRDIRGQNDVEKDAKCDHCWGKMVEKKELFAIWDQGVMYIED